MSTKIQINSLEALERLIGGESQLEFDIRQSVVEAFTKKHLKSIANSEMMLQLSKGIKDEATSDLVKGIKEGYYTRYVLTDKAKELVKDSLKYQIQVEIADLVRAEIGTQGIKEKLQEILERQVKYITEDLTDSALNVRLNAMVDKKLKEKLGIS